MSALLKSYSFFLKASLLTITLFSLISSPLYADIIFDFYGNHPVHGKVKAELHLKNNYQFGSDITAFSLIKLKFTSTADNFTIYPAETDSIYAALNIDGSLANSTGNFQFYLPTNTQEFFGTRTDGTWQANSDTDGNLGKWRLRTKGFKNVCISNDNFYKAASKGDVAYVNQCLKSGISVHKKEGNGWTALHSAAFNGRINIARILLKHGAKKNIKDKSGQTARDYAVSKKLYNMVAILDSFK